MALADDLLAVLDDPTHMWSHALRELSVDGQRLFLTLTLLPKPVSSDVLQIAYTAQTLDRSETFLESLRSLEDSFISIERRYADLRLVGFRNPSLLDFATIYIDNNSDWLDSLLSAPKYFEQIIIVFSLAMTKTATVVNPRDRSRKDARPKYPGIRRWVERRFSELITTAVNLLDAEKAEVYVVRGSSRLGQLLEIMAAYGTPTKSAILDKLRTKVEEAVYPATRESADVMVELLRKPNYRRLLDELLNDNACAVMRESILDKDAWKFAVLSDLDWLLELELEESWESWGNDYVSYARQLAEELADSTDDDELRVAIKELNSVGDMLGADLYNEISMLEQQREVLKQYEDYNDDELPLSGSGNAVDESAELDRIFASLL